MDIWALIKEVREGWPAVRAAKWAVAVALVAGAVCGFGVATLWWTGTVSTLRERLSFSQDKLQIALASPSNPAALLTKEPGRHLSDSDRKCLVEHFKDMNSAFKAIIISAFPDDEPRKYGQDFLNIFLRMGYKSGLLDGAPKGYEDVGLMVGLKDQDKPSGEAQKFIELIGKCVLINQKRIKYDPSPSLLPDIVTIDFDLFVGPKE